MANKFKKNQVLFLDGTEKVKVVQVKAQTMYLYLVESKDGTRQWETQEYLSSAAGEEEDA